MFGYSDLEEKIESLERKIEWIDNRYWELRRSHYALLSHLHLESRKLPETTVFISTKGE